MGAFQLSFFVFGVFTPVLARPISFNHGYNAIACIASFLAIIFFLTILVILKYTFIKHRYISCKSQARPSISAISSTTTASLVSSDSVHSRNNKAGFLVGFLGSPVWETRVKFKANTAYIRGGTYQHAHSWYQSHAESGQHTPNRQSRSSAANPPFRENACNSTDFCFVKQPDYPTKVHTKPESIRRLTLSSLCRTDSIQGTFWRKNHKSEKVLKQESGALSVPIDESTSLVEEKTNPSILLSQILQRSSLVNVPPIDDIEGQVRSRSTQNAFLPLPSPVATFTTSMLHSSPTTVHVSRPYALVSTVKSRPLCRPDSYHLSQAHDAHTAPAMLCSADDDDTSHVSGSTWSKLRGSSATSRLPLTPVIETCASELAWFQSNISSTTISDASPHSTQNTFLRKEKIAKTRRSPPIGPSPLRTMILPEVFLDTVDAPTNCLKRNENEDGDYDSLGLGILSPLLRPDWHSTDRDDDRGGKQLLDIIHELVEETKEWDSSLYMDANFKSLVSENRSEDPVPILDLNR